jgi:hypothetical protein
VGALPANLWPAIGAAATSVTAGVDWVDGVLAVTISADRRRP